MYSAYFKVHLQYQTKVVLDAKLSEFFLKSLMKYLLMDLWEWLQKWLWHGIYESRQSEDKNFILFSAIELVEFHGIRGCVSKTMMEKKHL